MFGVKLNDDTLLSSLGLLGNQLRGSSSMGGGGGSHPNIVLDTYTSSSSTQSPSITIGNNSNRLLIATIGYSIVASESVSSVKIGSTNFTKASSITISGGNFYQDVWYLINPPTGAETVAVTFASGSPDYAIGLISLYNCDQTNGINASSLATAGGLSNTTRSVAITPTNTGSWLIMGGIDEAGNVTPATNLYNQIDSSGTSFFEGGSYNSSPTINSSNTFSWTASGTGHWNAIAVEVLRA